MNKNSLDEYVKAGFHGTKELRIDERKMFLGQFRERILKIMLEDQIGDIRYLDSMLESMENPQAKKLLLRGDLPMEYANQLIQKAEKQNINFTFIDQHMAKGPVIVSLASDSAVNKEDIDLNISDLPQEFYIYKGKKICKDCYEYISQHYENEKKCFRKIGIMDYIMGMKCPIKSRHN